MHRYLWLACGNGYLSLDQVPITDDWLKKTRSCCINSKILFFPFNVWAHWAWRFCRLSWISIKIHIWKKSDPKYTELFTLGTKFLEQEISNAESMDEERTPNHFSFIIIYKVIIFLLLFTTSIFQSFSQAIFVIVFNLQGFLMNCCSEIRMEV